MIDLSRYANYGYDQRLEVFGPKGMLHIENDAPQRAVKTDLTAAAGYLSIFYGRFNLAHICHSHISKCDLVNSIS